MNEATWTPLLVAALAVLIAAFAFVKAHRAAPNGLPPLTPADVLAEVRAAQPLAGELAEVALTATQAAEQLYRTGQIAKTERLDRAVAYVQAWFPQLDVRLILNAVEAAVLVVNSMVDCLPTKPEVPAAHPLGNHATVNREVPHG